MQSSPKIAVIGAGLAGSEAALQFAKAGYAVRLYDMKPIKRSPAHHSNDFAEIVCSNSMGSQGASASGLLKQEMERLGSELLTIAQSVAVPAGKALAVDREAFARAVTERLEQEPLIELIAEDVTEIPRDADYVIIATGPMTSEGLSAQLASMMGRKQLYFFDAASPIVTKESINFETAFFQDRYGKSEEELAAIRRGETLPSDTSDAENGAYINCPLNEAEYTALYEKLMTAEKTPLKSFEEEQKTKFFESCMPVEVIASRGPETLRFGPLKPVGLTDPRTGQRPHAVVHLRQDNAEGTLYNLVGFQTNIKWGEQKEMIQMIPGLENADVVRFGVMHRNTFIHSPEVLEPSLRLKQHAHIFIAGQLTGTEGYTESIATGMLAAQNILRLLQNKAPMDLPKETMLGALTAYITRPEAIGKDFQPINSNWGILPRLEQRIKSKRERAPHYVERSLKALNHYLSAEKAPALV